MKTPDITELKTRIKDKFNSLSRFAMIAEIDLIEMNRQLASIAWRIKNERELHDEQVKYLNKLSKKCDTLNGEAASSNEFSISDLIRIKAAIDAAGGVRRFCEKNPEFKQPTVYAILDGDYTLRGKNAMRLIKKLKLA